MTDIPGVYMPRPPTRMFRIIIERSHVDSRWCVDGAGKETLCPAWAVPFIFWLRWRENLKTLRRGRSEGFKAFQAGRIKSTPWATDEEEMSRKSAVRKGSKYMPRSAEAFQRAVALDTMRDIGRDVTIDQTGEVIADAEDITAPPAPATSGRQLDGLEQRVSGGTAKRPSSDPVVIPVPQTANGFDWKQWADAAIAAMSGVTDSAWLDRWESLNKTALNNCEFNAHEQADRVADALKSARA